ncbi:MAG: DUF4384 domain-containing protein [Candidatus Sericytochromatia bacterium]|nr:DUF4384 domain-containing protein [Candidatus Sericytochromatia bacterium]
MFVSDCWGGLFSATAFLPVRAAEPTANRQWIQSSLRRCLSPQESPEALHTRTLYDLRRQAIERAAGVWVESQTWLQDQRIQQDRIQLFSRAQILREAGLQSVWQTPSAEALPCLHLSGRFLVAASRSTPAEAPRIQLSINQPVFKPGEDAWLRFQVNQTSFVSIYNVNQAGAVSRLLPNALQPEAFQAQAGQSYRFPDDSLRQHGLQLRPRLLPGQSQSQERILILATRDPLPDWDADVPEALFEARPSMAGIFYTQLQQRLLSMPPGSWNEAWLSYEILAPDQAD